MKKQLFLALSLAVLSLVTINCSNSSDDDTTTNQPTNQQPTTTQYFHPPAWIQGTWGVTNGTTSNKLFKFIADDFIMITGTSEQSMTGSIKAHPYGGSVDETSNNSTNYVFDVKFNNSGVTQHFEFRKASATQIQWKSNGTWVDLVKM